MQTLGLSDSMPRTEGRLKSLFWPSVQSSSDVDYLGAQGYWVCSAIAVLSFVILLISGHPFLGIFVFLVFYLGGVGVRERSRYAAGCVLVSYAMDLLVSGPSIARVLFTALLLANFRAIWIASHWRSDSEEAAPAPRWSETWSDKFADQLPMWLWPKIRIGYYFLSASYFLLVAIGFAAGVRGTRPVEKARAYPSETYTLVPGAVSFDIQPLPGENGHKWLATYKTHGKTAKFRIEIEDPQDLDDKESSDFDIKSGKGRFVAEPGSDSSSLLIDLKTALEAKSVPSKIRRVDVLSFTFVSFGSNQSQSPDGGFFANPPGNWTPMKIFIGRGDREAEVFLNLNPILGKGQFSIKDPDYGDIVLQQLASVL